MCPAASLAATLMYPTEDVDPLPEEEEEEELLLEPVDFGRLPRSPSWAPRAPTEVSTLFSVEFR